MKLTSILTKVLMALTGLAWFGFLIGHLTGNFLIYSGPEAFDAYGRGLRELLHGLVVYLTEIALAVFFITHMVMGIKTSLKNREARKQGYATSGNSGQSTLASRTMLVGGVIIAVFLVLHLYQFRMQWKHDDPSDSLWGLTVGTIAHPAIGGFYVLAMAFLGMHLSHGFGSAFQTLGIFKPTWRDGLRKAGRGLGWIIALGFASFPVWAMLTQKV
ncbi:MAG: succinate dehydrogenase cytochrome b subunit [Myxococcales bacterium]|nr:succinate dehydrogenase cytochrome b subunit [Myxococcales bacterium]MCB9645890.1 succinate dehydrogenase cytochrome b subunit [Deltaproteobacteria bacterium]